MPESKLIIIRGNSGSGKTTLARKLQAHYGRSTLWVSQDMVRREMLREKVEPNNLSIDLTEQILRFGYEKNLLVILEGFYEKEIYGQMLEDIRRLFGSRVLPYYYALSFEETVRRHETRAKKDDFSAADMKRWWMGHDLLGWKEEVLFTDAVSLNEAFNVILAAVEKL